MYVRNWSNGFDFLDDVVVIVNGNGVIVIEFEGMLYVVELVGFLMIVLFVEECWRFSGSGISVNLMVCFFLLY